MAEPGDARLGADPIRIDADSHRIDDAHNLMARNQRQLRMLKVAVDHMKVGPANGAGFHAQPEFAVTRQRVRSFFQEQRRSGLLSSIAFMSAAKQQNAPNDRETESQAFRLSDSRTFGTAPH